jgi:hypothetical protein
MRLGPASVGFLLTWTTAALLLAFAQQPAQATEQATLTPDAWGAVKIGMSRSAVESALHEKLNINNDASGSDACFGGWVGDMNHPKVPVFFTFVDGKLAVIGLRDGSISTDRGVREGDLESKVIAAYGSALKKEPAPYYDEKDPRHQLYFWSASQHGLLFWIDENGKVTEIQAGTKFLRASEGCA